MPVLHWYLDKLYTAMEHNPRLVKQFLQVMHMFRSPAALFLPHIAFRALTAPWRYRQAGRGKAATTAFSAQEP